MLEPFRTPMRPSNTPAGGRDGLVCGGWIAQAALRMASARASERRQTDAPPAVVSRFVCLLVGVMLAGAVLAAPAGAEEVIAREWAPSKVAHHGGVTVWSRLDRDTGRYHLMAHDGRRTRRIGLRSRQVPFDVELGPGRFGPTLVYSRCRREPFVPGRKPMLPVWSSGRGCDLYSYSLAANVRAVESRLRGPSTRNASEFLPSIWRDRIAFGRVYERRSGRRGMNPYLYVRELAGRARSRRMPGGRRGDRHLEPLGPLSLDLYYGRHLSFVWEYFIPEIPSTPQATVRVDVVGGRHFVVDRVRSTRRTAQWAVSPVGDRGRLQWGRDCLREGEMIEEHDRACAPFRTRRVAEREFPLSQSLRREASLPEGRLVSLSGDYGRLVYVRAAGFSAEHGPPGSGPSQARCRDRHDPRRTTQPGCEVVIREEPLEYDTAAIP
jgi:hypothetical protein